MRDTSCTISEKSKDLTDMKGKIREDEEEDLGKVGKEWSKKCTGELYAGG